MKTKRPKETVEDATRGLVNALSDMVSACLASARLSYMLISAVNAYADAVDIKKQTKRGKK